MGLIDKIKRVLNKYDGPFDVLAYATPYNHPTSNEHSWYAFEPSAIYPVTIRRMQEAALSDSPPVELVETSEKGPNDGVARAYLAQVQALASANALDRGLEEHGVYAEGTLEYVHRIQTLELARLWFTQALHVRIGGPIGVKILNDKRYKLY